ncbi:uncharacterized protein KGF55_003336 [Candida pseudojiufengensis]|uniref:uncharacterized protein n=1 Tax=Candida pseudojiufengensis TaxID=497109 RepID=UPI002223EEE8|nr:uncharacterized protein KGF55_003336 [Candida pseudojiufengensis]KAI5962260.1 hypothetical protein KGF55_003336 [Candida pseudojiufengensis]
MSLADGEYDVDVSVLLNTVSNSSKYHNENGPEDMAIRYGFVPDSMDESKLLKLYQRDQSYILLASSSESNKKPILFEGTETSHKDSEYYLTYDPTKTGDSTLKLNQLNSTIKVNKSRDILKLQSEIKELEKLFEKQLLTPSAKPERPPASPKVDSKQSSKPVSEAQRTQPRKQQNSEKGKVTNLNEKQVETGHSKWEQKRLEQRKWEQKKLELQKLEEKKLEEQKLTNLNQQSKEINSPTRQARLASSKTSPKKDIPARSLHVPSVTPRVASKRPPTLVSTPEQESIISESDFDDLKNESSDDDEIIHPPALEITSSKSKKEESKSKKKESHPKKSEVLKANSVSHENPNHSPFTDAHRITNANKAIKGKRAKKSTIDKASGDEFDDLENVLKEVLELDEGDPKKKYESEPIEKYDHKVENDDNENTFNKESASMTVKEKSPLSDADEEDDESSTYNFKNQAIKIDEGVSQKKTKSFTLNTTSRGRPRSLRELMGVEVSKQKSNNDGSSSEEE